MGFFVKWLNSQKTTDRTYSPTTTVEEGNAIPLGFGIRPVGSNVIRGLEASDDNGALIFLAAHCQGECDSSLATYLEDKEFGRYAANSYKEFFRGSLTQVNAQYSTFGDLFVDQSPYRGTAYTAFRVNKNDTGLSGEVSATAFLRLLKCEPIGGGTYAWTNNPAVILWHWYRVFEGKAAAELDENAFLALEELCAAFPTNSPGAPMRPVGPGEDTVKATSSLNAKYLPQFASDPETDRNGAGPYNMWMTSSLTNQRINFDLGFPVKLVGLRLVNAHHNGANTNRGIQNFIIQGSNSFTAFNSTNYTNDLYWTNVQTGLSAAQYNASTNMEEFFTVSSPGNAYRYYSIKIADNHGGSYLGIMDAVFVAITPRYCVDYVLDKQASKNDFKKLLWKAFNGCCIRSQGKIKPVWDWSQEHDAAGSLTAKTVQHAFDLDNIEAGKFAYNPPDRPNVVRVTYVDASKNYTKATVSVSDDADIAFRGEVVQEEKADWICYEDSARRRARQILDIARYADFEVKLSGLPDASHLEVFDLVTVTHALAGWTAKEFVVMSKKEDAYGVCDFELRAYHAGLYEDKETAVQTSYYSRLASPSKTPSGVSNLSLAENSYRNMLTGDWINQLLVTYDLPADSLYVSHCKIQISKDAGSSWEDYGNDVSRGQGYVVDGLLGDFQAGDTVYVRALPVTTLGKMADAETADTDSETLDYPDLATEIAAGGKIILPAGTYVVTSAISFPDKNITIVAAAGGDVVIQNNAGDNAFVLYHLTKEFAFKGLTFESQNSGSYSSMISVTSDGSLDRANNSANVIVSNCIFDLAGDSTGDYGVYYYAGVGNVTIDGIAATGGCRAVSASIVGGAFAIRNCKLLSGQYRPISILGALTDSSISIKDNAIYDWTETAIWIWTSDSINPFSVTGNQLYFAGTPTNNMCGIDGDDIPGANVSGNQIYMKSTAATSYRMQPLRLYASNYPTVAGNTVRLISDNDYSGNAYYYHPFCAVMVDATHATVTGNTITYDNSDTTYEHYGISVASPHGTVDNNTINGANSNAKDIGIYLDSSSGDLTGIANTITGCGTNIDDNGAGNAVGDQTYLGDAARKSVGTVEGELVDLDAGGLLPSAVIPAAAMPWGGGIANDTTDADHDVVVGKGLCKSITDRKTDIALASDLIKRLDASWSAGTGNGGLLTGSIAANTCYHVFYIGKPDGTSDAALHPSIDPSADLPSGYTLYRRRGSVITDGSSNIIPFIRKSDGQTFYWIDPPLDYDDSSSASAESITLSVPTGLSVEAIFNIFVGGTLYTRFSDLEVNDEAATQTAAPLAELSYFDRGARNYEFTDTAGQIRIRSSGVQNRAISTLGWRDPTILSFC